MIKRKQTTATRTRKAKTASFGNDNTQKTGQVRDAVSDSTSGPRTGSLAERRQDLREARQHVAYYKQLLANL